MAIAPGRAASQGDPVTPLPTGVEAPETQVPAEQAVRWRQGEERLYASLGQADVYELSLDLVRRTAEHLRGLGAGPGPLLAAAERGAGLVVEALGATAAAAAAAPVDLALVAQAALALRQREIVAEQTARRRVQMLQHGRDRGNVWVVLEESGDAQGSPLHPYRRLEAHTWTGRAVLVTTAPDPSFSATLHAVEGLVVDLTSGVLQELGDARAAGTTHVDAVERDLRAAALRQTLSQS